jgi:hypothetical protein
LFCRRVVTRGWAEPDRRHLNDLSAGTALGLVIPQSLAADTGLMRTDTAPRPHSIHAPIEYPMPTSFPSFFQAQDLNAGLRHTSRGILTRTRSVPMASTLASGYTLSRLFTQYANFVGQCVRRKIDWAKVGCIDKDEALQLRDDLWTLRDNFGEMSEPAFNGDEGLGEDEEA